jgi:hypothetical protein
MKTRVILTLCVVFVLGLVSNANAQATLVAGSPQDKAYTAAMAEQNLDKKIDLLLNFEKQFPDSKALPDIYVSLIDAYRQKNDNAKINEVGEKAIKADPENFTALMAVSRNYAIEKKNLVVAVQYAQKAVEVLTKRKTESRYNEDAQWKAYLDSIENAAKANLNYVKSVK